MWAKPLSTLRTLWPWCSISSSSWFFTPQFAPCLMKTFQCCSCPHQAAIKTNFSGGCAHISWRSMQNITKVPETGTSCCAILNAITLAKFSSETHSPEIKVLFKFRLCNESCQFSHSHKADSRAQHRVREIRSMHRVVCIGGRHVIKLTHPTALLLLQSISQPFSASKYHEILWVHKPLCSVPKFTAVHRRCRFESVLADYLFSMQTPYCVPLATPLYPWYHLKSSSQLCLNVFRFWVSATILK